MSTLAFGLPGHWEWVIILVIGLLLFGRRLPEVGRSLGKSIVEFKRGVKGIQDEIESESSRADEPERSTPAPRIEAPKDAAGQDARFGHESHVEVASEPTKQDS